LVREQFDVVRQFADLENVQALLHKAIQQPQPSRAAYYRGGSCQIGVRIADKF
jgi:hypothetical protein